MGVPPFIVSSSGPAPAGESARTDRPGEAHCATSCCNSTSGRSRGCSSSWTPAPVMPSPKLPSGGERGRGAPASSAPCCMTPATALDFAARYVSTRARQTAAARGSAAARRQPRAACFAGRPGRRQALLLPVRCVRSASSVARQRPCLRRPVLAGGGGAMRLRDAPARARAAGSSRKQGPKCDPISRGVERGLDMRFLSRRRRADRLTGERPWRRRMQTQSR